MRTCVLRLPLLTTALCLTNYHFQIICLSDIFISPLEDMYACPSSVSAGSAWVLTCIAATLSRNCWEPTSIDY